MPEALAGREMVFMGAYMLAITYFLLVTIVTAIFIILLIKWVKNGRRKENK